MPTNTTPVIYDSVTRRWRLNQRLRVVRRRGCMEDNVLIRLSGLVNYLDGGQGFTLIFKVPSLITRALQGSSSIKTRETHSRFMYVHWPCCTWKDTILVSISISHLYSVCASKKHWIPLPTSPVYVGKIKIFWTATIFLL